jgi:hypothetical protein
MGCPLPGRDELRRVRRLRGDFIFEGTSVLLLLLLAFVTAGVAVNVGFSFLGSSRSNGSRNSSSNNSSGSAAVVSSNSSNGSGSSSRAVVVVLVAITIIVVKVVVPIAAVRRATGGCAMPCRRKDRAVVF